MGLGKWLRKTDTTAPKKGAAVDKDKAKQIIKSLLEKAHKRFRQDLDGANEEFLDRVVRKYRADVSRRSWKSSQKWCKWNEEGPVLMPDYTRIYYRKGATEVLLQEFPPQNRIMKFCGALAKRGDSESQLSTEELAAVSHYSLALPYVVFLFKFVEGMFTEVRCAFSDRPLKKLDEKPLRPYLSNIDSTLAVCLGRSFDRSLLQKDNVSQQSALVLSHFWQSVYSDEWSSHFWQSKTHFQSCDPRMATLDAWQDAGADNPLFVVEDVQWLRHHEESFGDMIVRLFDGDKNNEQLHEELYSELVESFLDDVKKTFGDNIDGVESGGDKFVDELAEELLKQLS